MEVLRCGSCNYLVLFILARRGCDPQVSLFDHLSARVFRTGDGWVTVLPRYCDGVCPVYIRYCSDVHRETH
jgi:hypothetical protein